MTKVQEMFKEIHARIGVGPKSEGTIGTVTSITGLRRWMITDEQHPGKALPEEEQQEIRDAKNQAQLDTVAVHKHLKEALLSGQALDPSEIERAKQSIEKLKSLIANRNMSFDAATILDQKTVRKDDEGREITETVEQGIQKSLRGLTEIQKAVEEQAKAFAGRKAAEAQYEATLQQLKNSKDIALTGGAAAKSLGDLAKQSNYLIESLLNLKRTLDLITGIRSTSANFNPNSARFNAPNIQNTTTSVGPTIGNVTINLNSTGVAQVDARAMLDALNREILRTGRAIGTPVQESAYG